MPRPTPDDIPGEIRDQITALGYSGIMEYSEHLGLNGQRLLTIFRAKHSALKVYVRLCKRLGITLDALAEIIAAGELQSLLQSFAAKEQKSLRQLSVELGASSGFLAEKIRTPGLGMLTTYIEVSQVLNKSLQEFAEILLRNNCH